MSTKRIRIGGMSITTTVPTMAQAFDAFGTIVNSSLDLDPASGRSLGVGHIEYTHDAMAQAAIAGMNGIILDGARIEVFADR